MTDVVARTLCRDCGGLTFDTVLNLGTLAISTFPLDAIEPLAKAPLELVQCARPTCGLVQLRHTVNPAILFQGAYWYRSGINETMVAELRSIVAQACTYSGVRRGSVVVDIGANDGTLLQEYGPDVHRIAVEPSATFTEDLVVVRGFEHWARFFPDPQLIEEYLGTVRAVTSIACFYDLDDPHAFIQGVADLLAPDGVWIVQFQDLAQMLQATAFDNLCHEHLTYLSLRSIEHLVSVHGLEVVHAERRAINGGSLRCVVMPRGAGHVSSTVTDLRKLEDGCQDWETLAKFSWRVGQAAAQVRACVQAARSLEKTIDLYGASTKGNTLLQVAALGPQEIRQAWERSPAKWGRETVTGIPIVSEEDGREDPPDLFLCGIWQFRDAVLQREKDALKGRAIIFPLPQVEVVHVLDTTLDEMRRTLEER